MVGRLANRCRISKHLDCTDLATHVEGSKQDTPMVILCPLPSWCIVWVGFFHECSECS